jgi:hypothetical protein
MEFVCAVKITAVKSDAGLKRSQSEEIAGSSLELQNFALERQETP